MIKLRAKMDGWWMFRDVLREREPFATHGALRGSVNWIPGHIYDPCNCESKQVGQLPMKYSASVSHAIYVVWSYDTPIAWLTEDDGWIMPEVKYSTTTSAHQSKISVAIEMLGSL